MPSPPRERALTTLRVPPLRWRRRLRTALWRRAAGPLFLQPNLDRALAPGCLGARCGRTYPVRLLLRAGQRPFARARREQARVWEIPCDKTPVGGPTRSMKNGPKPDWYMRWPDLRFRFRASNGCRSGASKRRNIEAQGNALGGRDTLPTPALKGRDRRESRPTAAGDGYSITYFALSGLKTRWWDLSLTRGVAPGYMIAPRWGWDVPDLAPRGCKQMQPWHPDRN